MTTTIRIDDSLKARSDEVLDALGLSFSAAVTLFLKQVVNTRSIPFRIQAPALPNAETRKVLDGILDGTEPLSKPFATVDALMKDLGDA